ncbi:MAG: hypothetical protein ACRDWI_19540, partial [Jiangellaceae bacterium]
PGQGRPAAPVRPALIGAVVGVTGVAAAIAFSTAVHDAASNPARFGVVHQIEAWVGFAGGTMAPAEPVFAALADVPGVLGVNGIRAQVAETGGQQVTALSFSPVGAPLGYVVPDGRLPAGSTETLLSRLAADQFGLGVGDTISLTGTSGVADLAVVGVGVFDRAIGPLAVLTPAAYDGLFGESFQLHYAEIALEPGVEPETILPRLSAAVPTEDFGLFPFEFDSPAELRLMRALPTVLAAFVALLAVGAVGHAVATGVRRRRGELAVLRALG